MRVKEFVETVHDPRTVAERILDGWEIARENAELRMMNGQRCGNRQAQQLHTYARPQRQHSGKG